MGFVRQYIKLEEYLDKRDISWELISDSVYKKVLSEVNNIISSENLIKLEGDEAFEKVHSYFPFSAFLISAPMKKHLFSTYGSGGPRNTFGYLLPNLENIERAELNEIECVVVHKDFKFACMFNHEWQALCPEIYIEKHT